MDRPLRLLIVGLSWPPETFLERLIRGLIQHGVEVTIAGSKRVRDDQDFPEGLRWLRIPSSGSSYAAAGAEVIAGSLRAILASPGDFGKLVNSGNGSSNILSKMMRSRFYVPFAGRRWDVIYFPWNSAAVEYLPLFELMIPTIVSCRGAQVNIAPHNPTRRELRTGLEHTFKKATLVHCVSEAIMYEALKYGLEQEKTRVIRPAVDTRFFCSVGERQCGSGSGTLQLVTTGSLIWRKGYEYALLALRRILDSGVAARLTIIGDGHERQRILYSMTDLGLEEYVELPGKLSPESVRDRLRAADVFLLTSLSEGISNAALEAMACGLPVVTTDVGGMREAVTDGEEGFVVPSRDPDAIAHAITLLASDEELRRRVGEGARSRVVREFSIGNQIQKWLILLEEARDFEMAALP